MAGSGKGLAACSFLLGMAVAITVAGVMIGQIWASLVALAIVLITGYGTSKFLWELQGYNEMMRKYYEEIRIKYATPTELAQGDTNAERMPFVADTSRLSEP